MIGHPIYNRLKTFIFFKEIKSTNFKFSYTFGINPKASNSVRNSAGENLYLFSLYTLNNAL